MYPNLTASSSITTNTKKFSFPAKPTFNGERFTIFWDVGQDDSALSTYDSTSPLSTLCHTYQDYGEHTIKFSSNVKSLRLKNYFERIKRIESRSQVFQSLTYLYWCRNLKTIDISRVKEVPTLASTNAFTGLPSDYKVLVDQALAPKLRAAQGWSAIASHIRAV